MHRDASRTGQGIIKIHKNVISSIASIAAMQVEGVNSLSEEPANALLSLLRKRFSPVIKVEINKNEEVSLEIPLVVKYDFNIPDVADKVQESIRHSLEKMTNLSIKEININVQRVAAEDSKIQGGKL
jgi:uncharacterized alkaline shock family protein YloU